MKIDKRGNIIKQERFLDLAKPEFFNNINDMIITSDGNFILIFETFIPDNYPIQEQQNILQIVKFDEDLNLLWNKTMNSDLQSGTTAHITEMSDGGFVVSWSFYRQDLPEEIRKKFELKGLNPRTITRFDEDGEVLWSDTLWTKRYGKGNLSPDRWINKLLTAANGDVIGIGCYQDRKPEKKYAYMFRYSPDGTLLWEKIYKDVNYECDNSFFLDVKEADNGDLVSVGELWDINGAWNDATYTWLVRVDSMGCFEPGCCPVDTLQMIYVDNKYVEDLTKQKDESISIHPNPAYDFFTISMPDYCSPDYCCDESGIYWSIYDTQSRKVKYGTAPERWSEINIGVKDLQTGIYIVNIFDRGRKIVTNKKIVIR